MTRERFLPESELRELVRSTGAQSVFVNACLPVRSGDDARLWFPMAEATDEQIAAGLRSPRPHGSFKAVLLPARETVARYGAADSPDPLAELAGDGIALVGLRGSECRALRYLDKVMLGEPEPDPFYAARRAATTIISVDCVNPCESCFCNVLGEKAYAEEGFDLNLSPIEGGYIVEPGSGAGEALLAANAGRLADVTDEQTARRAEARDRTAERLAGQNAGYGSVTAAELAELMPASARETFWLDELSTCVQCGACTAVCPTCYCFLLHDLTAQSRRFERVRLADSCQFTGYTVMAGPPGLHGPDPRPTHRDKFQRRFAHKFWHDVAANGVLGCVGCGRCRDSCPGAIDLRRVIAALKEKQPQNA
jgi:sulfhydrogenase subunit beta (sulfur reductase)